MFQYDALLKEGHYCREMTLLDHNIPLNKCKRIIYSHFTIKKILIYQEDYSNYYSSSYLLSSHKLQSSGLKIAALFVLIFEMLYLVI